MAYRLSPACGRHSSALTCRTGIMSGMAFGIENSPGNCYIVVQADWKRAETERREKRCRILQ